MSRNRSKLSNTGKSHQSCVRCPNTTPIRATCAIRFSQGTRPSTVQPSGIRHQDPRERLHRRRFPRTVWADVTDKFPLPYLKGNAVQGVDGARPARNEPTQRPAPSRSAFRHLIGLGEIFDDDLVHDDASGAASARKSRYSRKPPTNVKPRPAKPANRNLTTKTPRIGILPIFPWCSWCLGS